MLFEGRFDKKAIRESLGASAYFLKSEDAAPWQVVGNFDKLEDDVVTEAAAKMEKQFNKREVTDTGEMLHIFALRMMISSKAIVNKDIATVTEECKAYVDDLLRSERLPHRGLNWDWYRNFEDSAYGVVFWVTEDYRSQFNEVYRYLIDARTKALETQYPARAQELLKIVESDGQKFFEEVCVTHSGKNQYARIPILAANKAEDFVASWMKSPKENWYWIRNDECVQSILCDPKVRSMVNQTASFQCAEACAVQRS